MKTNCLYSLLIVLSLFLLKSELFSQNIYKKMQIAILDFDGQGISNPTLISLTTQFRGHLVELNNFIVLDRGKMQDILSEQEFQLTGCTSSECAVEVGRILNVRKMVSGNIGKVGKTYSVTISLIDVETSRIEKSYNRIYNGEIDGLLNLFKEIAYSMSGKTMAVKSKMPLYIFGTATLASIGFGTYSYIERQKSYQNYQDAKTISDMKRFKNETKKFNDNILYSSIAAGTSILLYFIFEGLFDSNNENNSISANIYSLEYDTYNLSVVINF